LRKQFITVAKITRHAIFIRSNASNIQESPLKLKKIFLLITVFICLLAPSVNARVWGESGDMVDLKDQRTLADDFTDFSINNKPVSIPADIRGPKSWGPRPDNPGYIHFIERPHEGNPPFVPIAPEPASYLLFIVGAAALSGKVYLKRKK
jgi:hypothetical protein